MASGKSFGTINYQRKLYGNYIFFFLSFFPFLMSSLLLASPALTFQFVEQNCNYFLMFSEEKKTASLV